MSGTSKEAERAELHKTIWRIANDLRGSVDGWDFKTYVLGHAVLPLHLGEPHRLPQRAGARGGQPDFDYASLVDADAEFGREETVEGEGLLHPALASSSPTSASAPRTTRTSTRRSSRVFTNIEGSAVGTDSEDDLKGLFDDLDVNSSKLGPTVAKRNEKLVKLLDAIGDLPLGRLRGQHHRRVRRRLRVPHADVRLAAPASPAASTTRRRRSSELLARITVVGKTEVNKVYDPACGSGSLLLKFAKVLGTDNVRQGFFGQEINLTTYNLCRINMFLHDVNYEKFDIAHGDTLTDPAHWDDEPFEAIVSNPPYSIKWEGDANPLLINDPRYAPAGVLAPEVEGRPGLHDAHPELARGQRHGRDRRVPRRALPRRRGAEDPQVPDRQQLRRRGHPAAARPLLRHDDRHLHHRAQEVEDRQRSPVHRRLGRVHPRRATRTSSPTRHQQRILDAFTAREDVAHFATLVDQRRDRRERLQHRGLAPTSKPRTPARPSTSPPSTPRSPASSPARPSCAPQIDAIVADLEGVT